MIIETPPKWSYSTLDHELANDTLVKIFCSSVNSLGDQVPSIDMLLTHTPFTFLSSDNALLFELSSFSFLFRFFPPFSPPYWPFFISSRTQR